MEKESLARFTHSPILEEQFNMAVLRFTDQTAKGINRRGEKPDHDDPERPSDFPEKWNSSPRIFARKIRPESLKTCRAIEPALFSGAPGGREP